MSTIELEKPQRKNDADDLAWNDVPEWVLRDIEEAERQLDAGLGTPHEEVMEEMRQWLGEK